MKTFHIKPDLSHRKPAERPALEFGALELLPYRRILVALTGAENDTSVLRYLSMLDDIGSVSPNPNVHGVSDLEEERPSIFFHHLQKGRKTLMNLVAQEGIDLILVGRATHQTKPMSDLRYLVLQTPCPVWVIPDSVNAPKLQSIVVPMGLRTPFPEAVQAASAIAEALHIPECLALHAYFLETRFLLRNTLRLKTNESGIPSPNAFPASSGTEPGSNFILRRALRFPESLEDLLTSVASTSLSWEPSDEARQPQRFWGAPYWTPSKPATVRYS